MSFKLPDLGLDPAMANAVVMGMVSALVALALFAALLHLSNKKTTSKKGKVTSPKRGSVTSGTVLVSQDGAVVRRSVR